MGVGYDVSIPTADALSIVIPIHTGNAAAGNTIQINILEGNVFNTQLGLFHGNFSNNSTSGGVTTGNGNRGGSSAGVGQSMIGASRGTGNTIQINILSFNIYNPQYSIGGGNVSNNTTVSNVASNNGNNSNNGNDKATPGGLFGSLLLGGLNGNGNTTQFAFGSGNIINPQFSLGGANVSNNTAVTNVAADNGNGSTQYLSANFLGSALFGGSRGNGNTIQVAGATSNIVNPQYSFGDGNSSNNSSTTNYAGGNGNGSNTVDKSPGLIGSTTVFGLTGNGNTNQAASGSGNILNDQVNVGLSNSVSAVNTFTAGLANSRESVGTGAVTTSTSTNGVNTSSTTNPVGRASAGVAGDSVPTGSDGSSRVTTGANQTLGSDRRTVATPANAPDGNGSTSAGASASVAGGRDPNDRPAGAPGNAGASGGTPGGASGGTPGGSGNKGDA